MTLPLPSLDDRDFADLVTEARGLIPRLAPIWTNHNLSDPGITLIDLLAWLGDQQIYRVGHVGERHRRAFTALLGVRPTPPRPARGLIWPEAAVRYGHTILAGTRAVPIEQPQLGCLIERNIYLTPAVLRNASAVVSGRRINLDVSFITPQASFAFAPRRGSGNVEGGLLELTFDRPLLELSGNAAREETVALGIEVPSRPVAVPASDVDPLPWGPLRFDYRIGAGSYQPVQTVFDGTFALSTTGVVLVRLPAAKAGTPSTLRLRLDQGFFPVAPEIARITPNVLPVRQAEREPEIRIGTGNGLPDQTIELTDLTETALAAPGFAIRTEEQGVMVEWQPTEDFCRHGPTDRVYRLEPHRRRIVFGNGVNGRMPAMNMPILRAAFEHTEGRRGNLAAGLPWRIDGVPVDGAYGRNPAPISGGQDGSDADQLTADAQAEARRRDVLLSDDDLRNAAASLAGFMVGRAEVLYRRFPQRPNCETPGARTLVVMPWRRTGTAVPDVESRAYPQAIAQALASRRLLGERLSVIGARRVRIRVEATLLVARERDPSTVIRAATRAIDARLTDIPLDRDSANGDSTYEVRTTQSKPWPLGRPVTLAEIETVLARTPGVHGVLNCRLAWADEPFAAVDIVLASDEVAVGGDHVLSARGETGG